MSWNDMLWYICPKTKFSGTCVAMMGAALTSVCTSLQKWAD